MNIRTHVLVPLSCMSILVLSSAIELMAQPAGPTPERERHMHEMDDEWSE